MTIPNLATYGTAHVMTIEELCDVSADTFLWIELPKMSRYNKGYEAELYYLRLNNLYKYPLRFDFACPHENLMLTPRTYNKDWRVWNMCPSEEQAEQTPWDEISD